MGLKFLKTFEVKPCCWDQDNKNLENTIWFGPRDPLLTTNANFYFFYLYIYIYIGNKLIVLPEKIRRKVKFK